eukprot:2772355-Rhodomonas_salina.1
MVEADGGSTRTFQGVDYALEGRRTSPSAEVYRDAWVVRGCRLSVKRHAKGRGRSAEGAYDTARSFPTTLVFVAGPNAGAKGGCKSSSMRRTYRDVPYAQRCRGRRVQSLPRGVPTFPAVPMHLILAVPTRSCAYVLVCHSATF